MMMCASPILEMTPKKKKKENEQNHTVLGLCSVSFFSGRSVIPMGFDGGIVRIKARGCKATMALLLGIVCT